jgi:polysaccharide pyruvyl transferase WcaK-like protein
MVLKKVCNGVVNWLAKHVRKSNYQYDAYLVGYYGMKNSGDDALLMASVMGAKNELKMNKLLVSCAHESLFLGRDVTLNLIHQTPKYKGQNRLKHYQAAMNSRRIIFGGGSVFHTAQDIEVKRHMMKLSGGERCLAVGVSLGPFVDAAAREECKKFLHECHFIGVRDKQSLELAQQLVPNANVKLTFDLAPLVMLDPSYSSHRQQDKGVLINVCPIPKTAQGSVDRYQQESLLVKMQQLIERVWQETQMPITLVSLNGHLEFGDDTLCQQLLARCDDSIAVSYLPYHSNPLRMIEQIRNFNA